MYCDGLSLVVPPSSSEQSGLALNGTAALAGLPAVGHETGEIAMARLVESFDATAEPGR